MNVREVESSPDRLVIEAELPGATPAQTFDYWVQPEQVTRWWSAEAENEPRAGGWYHFSWPAQGWHLRGRYTLFEPGRALGFTWQWDHEPDRPMRHVDVDITGRSEGDGSHVTVTHALYGPDAADREERDSHREGWLHFLRRLEGLSEAA